MTEIADQREPTVDPVVIAVVGELDMTREHEILDLVIALDPAPDTQVHIDMRDVTFVDSGGLNALLKANAYLDGRRCQLRLLNPRQQLVRIIDIVGLRGTLNVDLTDSDGPGSPNVEQPHSN